MDRDLHRRVKEMFEQRAVQIAEERAAKRTGRTLAEDVARVTAATRRLGASHATLEATPGR